MRKLKLDVEALEVETFAADDIAAPSRGTVHGQWSQRGTCDGFVATCQYGGTCGPGCGTAGCTGTACV